jgi:hypothetical protein
MKSPLIDPFKDQLAKLSPGDKLIVKNITFYKNNNEIVVLAKTKHHENFNRKRTVATVVPSNPIIALSSLMYPTGLPEISVDVPDYLRRHSELFNKPELLVDGTHAGAGRHCHCSPTALGFHMPGFIKDICLKRNLFTASDCIVPVDFSYSRVQPNRRTHIYDEATQTYIVCVPQPWFISWAWPYKPYRPMHSQALQTSPAIDLTYSLYSADSYVEHRKPFLKTPENWTPKEHPFFEEPGENDEL